MFWFRRSDHPEEELSAYVDGELGDRARHAVERHLATCEACSTLLRELQDAKSLLSELPRLELRRSLVLGQEFAVERRPAPAPRRSPFTFAPAVALTVLVALLFVDAAHFSNGGSSDDSGTFTAASREAQPEAGGGVLEATKAEEPNAAADSAAAAETQDGDDASAGGAGAAGATGESQAQTESAEAAESPVAAMAPPSGTVAPEVAPEPLTAQDQSADTFAEPEETSQFSETNDSSDGFSTLRILEIAAAIAFAVSLAAVFLPRIVGRRER